MYPTVFSAKAHVALHLHAVRVTRCFALRLDQVPTFAYCTTHCTCAMLGFATGVYIYPCIGKRELARSCIATRVVQQQRHPSGREGICGAAAECG
jgi:hypothetical protein